MEWDIIGEEVKAEDGEEAEREEEDIKIKGVKMELEEVGVKIEEGVKEVVKEGVTMPGYMVQVLVTPEQHHKSLSIIIIIIIQQNDKKESEVV